jgi:hypothetical protein
MPVGAAIGAAGGLASAGINYFASGNASEALQAGYANQQAMLDQAWARSAKFLKPYANVGRGAMQSLGALYGIDAKGNQDISKAYGPEAMAAFERSPDYAYARDSAMKTLGFSNAASGLLRSSEHLRSATGLASNLATQNFGNYTNALRGLGGWGLDASKSLGQIATGLGTAGATAAGQAGQAQAAGIMGQAGAITSGINSVTNPLIQYNALNRNNSAYASAAPAAGQTDWTANPWQQGGLGDPMTHGNLRIS